MSDQKPGLFKRLFGAGEAAPAPSKPDGGDAPQAEGKRSWWSRLKQGLARSSSQLGQGIVDIFTKRRLDAAALEDLEDILVRADLGVAAATRITAAIGKGRFDKEISPDEVKAALAAEVEAILTPVARPLA
ncbi:MAG: signal recognition particle receptor subunit alpha, partial [Methylobacteriaceae bacterium]|nr:signal recognition particle receptor subunit alpha [Methylobacteriaceae bacterium]